MQNNSYFSNLNTIRAMASQTFVNKKLEFVEELVRFTDSNIFLTGKAGTGKTTFLRNLQSKTFKRIVVLAPTGVAAINAGGQTIHSFFQLPFGPQLPEDAGANAWKQNAKASTLASQFQKLRKNKLNLIRSLDLVVIDEISMVRADVLDAVDAVLRRARRSSKPFGGVQLLMIGDVHQLAPVARAEEWSVLAPYYNTPYFFGSHVLQKSAYLCVELEHIYRQHDADFIDLLNKVRNNQMDAQGLRLLNLRFRPDFKPKNEEGYITLTTHNYQADQINESKLAAIDRELLCFEAEITGTFPENTYPTKEKLELKIGAQVMFVKNDPSSEKAYYNGKIGQLVGYDDEKETLEVKCDGEIITVSRVEWENNEYTLDPETNAIEEKTIGTFKQIPLRLAWAVTIHKSQGLTFEKVIIDAGQAFAHGQVYVALSRCTSLDGLVLKTRIQPTALIDDAMVDQFVGKIPELEPTQEKVDDLRHQYELDTMAELIDFMRIYQDFGRLSKIVLTNDTLFEAKMIQDLTQRRQRVHEELCTVSLKFEGQINKLHAENQSCEQNAALQERLTKGVAYFKEHLTDITKGIFDLPFKTDNQAINDQITDALKLLQEDLYVKNGCLEACKNGFSMAEYQKTKSTIVVEAEKDGKKKITIKDDTMDESPLYKALSAWRRKLAEKLDTPIYNIALNAMLKAVAQEMPTSQRALKKIKGFGDKRIKLYGADIIDIVLKHLGQTSIAEETEPEPEPEPKKEKVSTYEQTLQLLKNGMTAEEIAGERELQLSTIQGHFARFVGQGLYEAKDFLPRWKIEELKDYFESTGDRDVAEAKDVLGDRYSFGEIRIMLAQLDREHFFENLPKGDEDF